MKISGYGEFQQLRKSMQMDEAQQRDSAERREKAELEAGNSDAVSISPQARRKGKLRMASDFRADKVADVKARLEAGTLVTEESLRSGTRKMVDGLVSGEL